MSKKLTSTASVAETSLQSDCPTLSTMVLS